MQSQKKNTTKQHASDNKNELYINLNDHFSLKVSWVVHNNLHLHALLQLRKQSKILHFLISFITTNNQIQMDRLIYEISFVKQLRAHCPIFRSSI